MLNNLDKHLEKAEATASFAPPTGTRAEQGAELIRRCRERDKKLEAQALECERAGDADGTWLNMAARAENKRLIERIEADLKNMKP